MMGETKFKEYFDWVSEDQWEAFVQDISGIIETRIKPFLGTGLPAKPTDAQIKKDAAKLLKTLESFSVHTDLAICKEAGLSSVSLRGIKKACRALSKRHGKKHRDEMRMTIIYDLDFIYRRNGKASPKDDRARFVDFVHSCFLLVNPNYPPETAESMVKDYLNDTSLVNGVDDALKLCGYINHG